MASKAEALTAAHRKQQIALRAKFLREFVTLYGLLEFNQLDRSAPHWLRIVMTLIRIYRQESANRANHYYQAMRQAEILLPHHPAPTLVFSGPGAPAHRQVTPARVLHVPASDTRAAERAHRDTATHRGASNAGSTGNARDTGHRSSHGDVLHPVQLGELRPVELDWTGIDQAAQRALVSTGPAYLKHATAQGMDEEQATKNGLVIASGTASKHVAAGGRETTMTLINADDEINHYARGLGPKPCAFCSMLASRGAVYLTKRAASFDAHGHCMCFPVPVVDTKRYAGKGTADELKNRWRDVTAGYSGKDALNAWRRDWERRTREANRQAAAQTA